MNTNLTHKRERIFSELRDLIPLGENDLKPNPKTLHNYNSSIHGSFPKPSFPLDDETFEILAEELTDPYCHQQRGGNDDFLRDNDDVIKRSYRIMTYIVQDMQEAQNFLVNKFGNQEKYSDILYTRNLINPTRASLLVKRIFSAYRQLVAFYQDATDTYSHIIPEGPAPTKENDESAAIIHLQQPVQNHNRAHLPHLNQTMRALLQAFPSQVIGASSRGGEKGLEQSLEPMLQLYYLLTVTWTRGKGEDLFREETTRLDGREDISSYMDHPETQRQYSPLDIIRDIIILGCTGIRKYASPGSIPQTQQMQQMLSLQSKTLINVGHRRKFVHGLTKWGGLEQFVSIIYKDTSCAQHILEALLDIVEVLLYHDDSFWNPSTTDQNSLNDNAANAKTCRGAERRESAGEEALLDQLASPQVIHALFEGLVTDPSAVVYNEAISSALLGLFELATGKKKQQTQPQDPSRLVGNEEDRTGNTECKMAAKDTSLGMEDNAMIKAGITDKLHATICQDMKSLVKAMNVYMRGNQVIRTGKENGVPHVCGSKQDDSSATRDVVYPRGRDITQPPFTSTRLQLLTLFTDLVSYKCNSTYRDEHESAVKALSSLMEFPLPSEHSADIEFTNQSDVVYNPWPGICDLVFEYPENNLLHVQFYRLIHALCITNHEPTLKLLVQNCKFLSRAVKICCTQDKPCSTRGILLRCLNALRLHSESISPHSFLRHYLESHDGWKAMQDEINRMTIEQEQRGGGIAVPNVAGDKNVATSKSDVDVGLGSLFAFSLGFHNGIQPYNVTSVTLAKNVDAGDAISSLASKKKKKLKKKKSKK
jgi:hypothetical protein